MYRQEFETLLRSNQPPRGVILYGECHFLIEHYLRQLSNIPDANALNLYHDEYNFESAKAHLSQGSLFGGLNLLLLKSEKKIPKKELDTLLELVQKNPDNILLYAYYGTDKAAAKAFNKKSGGVEVRLYEPYESEKKKLIIQEAQRMNMQLDGYAATHLIDSQNGDLNLAFNELDKLSIKGGAISVKDIDALVYGMGEIKLEDFINHLLMKKDFKHELAQILESGEDEIRILTAITAHLTQLYLFYAHIKMHGVADSKAILGYKLPRQIEQDRAAQSIRLKQHQYSTLLELLLKNELKMKSSGTPDKNALLLATLMELQRLI